MEMVEDATEVSRVSDEYVSDSGFARGGTEAEVGG